MPVFDRLQGTLYQANIAPGFVQPYQTKETFDDLIKAEDTAAGLAATMKRDQVLNADFNKNTELFTQSMAALDQVSASAMHPRDKLNATRKLAGAVVNNPLRNAQLKSVDERTQHVKNLESNTKISPEFKEFAIEKSDEDFNKTQGTQPLTQGGYKTYSATQYTSPDYVADQDILKELKFERRGNKYTTKIPMFDPKDPGKYIDVEIGNEKEGISIPRVEATAAQIWNQNWKGIQDSHKQEVLIDLSTRLRGTQQFQGMTRPQIADILQSTEEGQQILNNALAEKRRVFIDNASYQLAGEVTTGARKESLGFVPGYGTKTTEQLPVEIIPNLITPATQNADGSINFSSDIWGNLVKTPDKLAGEALYDDFQKTREEIAKSDNPVAYHAGLGITGIAKPFVWLGSKAMDVIDYGLHGLGIGNEPVDKNSDSYKRAERRAKQLNPNYHKLSESQKQDAVEDAGKRWAGQTYQSNMLSLTPSPDAVKQNEAETKIMFGDNQDIKNGLQQNQSTVKNWSVSGEEAKQTPKQLADFVKDKTQGQYLGINYDPFSHYEYGSKNFAFTDTEDNPRVATSSPDISKKNETTEAFLSRGGDKYIVKPYLVNRIYNVMNYQASGKGKVDYYEGNTASQLDVNYTPDGKLYLTKGNKTVPISTTYSDGTPMSDRDLAVFAAYVFDKNF